MKKALAELFASKKFLMMLTGIIVAVGAKYGLQLDADLVNLIIGLIGVFILGQGIADNGKSAAQIKADAPQMPEQVNIQNVEAPKPTDDLPSVEKL